MDLRGVYFAVLKSTIGRMRSAKSTDRRQIISVTRHNYFGGHKHDQVSKNFGTIEPVT